MIDAVPLSNNPLFHSFFTSQQWFGFFSEFVNHSQQNFSLELTPEHDIAFFSCAGNSKYSAKMLNSMTNYYSPIFGLADQPLSKCPDQQTVKQQKEAFSKFDFINVVPLFLEQANNWKNAFEQIGFRGFIYQHSVNWYETNISNLDDFWQRRPSKLINTLKRKQDLMRKQSGFTIRIYNEGNQEQLMQALIDYHQVYYHSWKRSEPTPAFIDSICQFCWSNQALRIGVIYFENKPIAAQIWFVYKDTAKIFKLAYHTDYNRFSPGTVLTAALMDYVINQDKVQNIDFLTGNDEYKKDWMSEKRYLYGLQLCNKTTIRGQIGAAINNLSRFKTLTKNQQQD